MTTLAVLRIMRPECARMMGNGLTAGESDYCSTEDGKTGSPQIDWSGPKVLRWAGAAKSDELIRRLAATVVLSSVRSVRWQKGRHAPRWSGRSLAACVGQRGWSWKRRRNAGCCEGPCVISRDLSFIGISSDCGPHSSHEHAFIGKHCY